MLCLSGILAALWLVLPSPVSAKCTNEEKMEMILEDKSDEEIARLCGEQPQNLPAEKKGDEAQIPLDPPLTKGEDTVDPPVEKEPVRGSNGDGTEGILPSTADSQRLWRTYRLAKKRGLNELEKSSLRELLENHPDTTEGLEARLMLFGERLGKEGVTLELEEELNKLHAQAPARAALLREKTAQWLLAEGDRLVEAKKFDQAERRYQQAAIYGVYAAALRQRRLQSREQRIRHLIENRRFQAAGEQLVLWEASGKGPQATLDALYKILRRKQQEIRHKQKWRAITALIKQNGNMPVAREVGRCASATVKIPPILPRSTLTLLRIIKNPIRLSECIEKKPYPWVVSLPILWVCTI